MLVNLQAVVDPALLVLGAGINPTVAVTTLPTLPLKSRKSGMHICLKISRVEHQGIYKL